MAKSSIKHLVANVLSGREHANELLEVMKYISPDESRPVVLEAVKGVMVIFNKFSCDGDMLFTSSSEGLSTDDVYRSWIGEQLNDCFNKILECFCEHKDKTSFLKFCMELLQLKSKHQSKFSEDLVFPDEELSNLCAVILSDFKLVLIFNEFYLNYDDVRHFVMKILPKVINQLLAEDAEHIDAIFMFLQCVVSHMPQSSTSLNTCFVCDDDGIEEKFNVTLLQHKKKFSLVWLELLKHPLPASIHKNILVMLHTSLIPNFAKPRLLADFLMQSYSRGGGLALLGLHGLFVLMHQYNLEYPDFYKNVYSMLHPRIFNAKYKARFFHLLDLFLSSTHIPAYLVAAFVKKMARLCLAAPPSATCIMVALILNLLKRHPNIRHLIHSDNQADDEALCDPFIEDETEPIDCHAMESSLWELATLKNHYSSNVVKRVTLKGLGTLESDISDLLDQGYDDLFSDSCSAKMDTSAMNHVAAESLFGGFEDSVSELWSMNN